MTASRQPTDQEDAMAQSSEHPPREAGVPIQRVIEELTMERAAAGSLHAESAQLTASAVGRVQSHNTAARFSAVSLSQSETATFERSTVAAAYCKDSATLNQTVSRAVLAGNVAELSMSAGGVVAAGGYARLRNAGAGVVLAPRVSVERGWVGLVLAGKAELGEAKVMVAPRGMTAAAAAFGAALGITLAALRRRKR
jgi:hypothetical protein